MSAFGGKADITLTRGHVCSLMLWTAPALRHQECHRVVAQSEPHSRGASPWADSVSTIGLDIAKSVFQVHGVYCAGAVVMRKRVGRAKVLEFFSGLVAVSGPGSGACPSAHHWSRELQAFGHTVRPMPPSYVKAYRKRSKNDANDAAA